MKTTIELHLLLLAAGLGLPGFAHAQGTAFGYQGRLQDGGAPATGLYDFTFTLFDVDIDGAALAGPIPQDAVPVTNGLFNVSLDFGPDLFTGPARWLEVSVRANGVGDPIILTPRTPLLPTPYSIFAASASDVVNGSVVKSLNTLKDDVTLAAGANVTLTPNGNTLTIDSAGVGGSGIWHLNDADTYFDGGKVGIGTTTPRGALHVASGGLAVTGSSSPYSGAGAGVFMESNPGGGFLFAYDYSASLSRPLILNSPGGNVGIGTITPASKLTVRTGSSPFTGYGIEHTDGTVRLTTYVDGFSGWLGTRSNHPLNFFYNDGLASMTIGGGGIEMVSGLGTVTVGSPNAESGTSIKRGGNRADVRFNGSTLKLVAAPGAGPPPSTYGLAIDTAGNVGIGTDAPMAKLDVRGTTRTCVLTITGGCDLAEPFPLKDESVSKGSVVVIDDEHPGRLMRSDRAYDSRVAGIISGANGINPGITLQQEGAFVEGPNVALSGRVYVLADATHGAIKPGDLLTTSETPGHAMRAADLARAQGAILGKAMSGLKNGKGMVLVLVTLQ